MGADATPRTDSLVEIIDEKEVFVMTMETLLTAIGFFRAYSAQKDIIEASKNKYHVIMPDALKTHKTRQF
jgi:hypothetical protein